MAIQKRNSQHIDLQECDFVRNNGELHFSHVDIAASPYSANKNSVMLVTTGAGAIIINLPRASGCPGKVYVIKKIDSGIGRITITPNVVAGDLIDGGTTYNIIGQWDSVIIFCDGADWYLL